MSTAMLQRSPEALRAPSPLRVTMEMVTRFENRLRGVVDYGSFSYECPLQVPQYQVGVPSVHSCEYTLRLADGRGLGRVVFTRSSPFKESELQLLETCLGDLCLQLQRLIPHELGLAAPALMT